MLPILLVTLLGLQAQPLDPALAARITELFHTAVTGDDARSDAAHAEARRIFVARGLPTIADVGDEAAYTFVVLGCSRGSDRDRAAVLSKAKQAVACRALSTDAVTFCEVASTFVTMVQHQSPEFRRKVLPRLRTNVDAGQADPSDYTRLFDRTARPLGSTPLR